MNRFYRPVQWAAVGLLILSLAIPVSAASKTGYQTGLTLWDDFSGWEMSGTSVGNGGLQLSAGAQPGTDPYPPLGYYGGNYYNGGSFLVGEATGPWVIPGIAFSEAIASWNVDTPEGTWIETQVQAKIGDRLTKWYSLGIWASETSTVQRHSVKLQGDADGYVAVDTLVLAKAKVPASELRLKVRLFTTTAGLTPTLRSLSLTYSPSAPKKVTTISTFTGTAHALTVPACSQMVYPDGGEVWCSPTSTSMVLGYYGVGGSTCEERVLAAVAGVYDWIYQGHGNWPFNTAYAQSAGRAAGVPLNGYVVRYSSLAQLEPWIAQGVPVVMSIAWGKGELTGAPIPSSSGHLIVLTGFDADGNALVNDPAAGSDADVPRTYLRNELESVWLTNSGGTVYLIVPADKPVSGF